MEKWIAMAVGMMHIHGITQSQLAEKMGVRREHVNKILNGALKPKGAKERIEGAIKELISINE